MRAAAAAAELESLDGDRPRCRPCAARCWCRRCARSATTTPGSSATTLLPSSHCSRSASNWSPPVSTTRISDTPSALRHDLGQRALLLLDDEVVGRVAGTDGPVRAPSDDLREQRDQVAVAHRDHRVEVHVAARLRQVHGQHELRRAGPEQRRGRSTAPPAASCARPCRS